MVTTEQKKAAVDIVVAAAEAVRTSGKDGIPAGVLYAHLMPTGIDAQGFDKLVSILTGSGLVREQSHLLRWVGPELKEGS